MTVGWGEILLLIAWIGPFAFAALFTFVERRYPDSAYPKETHLGVNVLFGAMTALMSFFFLQTSQQFIADTVSVYDFIDFSELFLPAIIQYGLCFLFIDFIYYAQHWLSHHLKPLWRLHKVHHADDRMTASTSLVHHPLEAIFVAITAFSLYVLVNMPLGVILAYGAVNSFHVAFVHSNMKMPHLLDKILSKVIYTPSLHKIHHSISINEGNSNYGMIFVFWDKILATWLSGASVKSSSIRIGLEEFQKPRWTMKQLLLLPFK